MARVWGASPQFEELLCLLAPVTLGREFHGSKPWFAHLQHGNDESPRGVAARVKWSRGQPRVSAVPVQCLQLWMATIGVVGDLEL